VLAAAKPGARIELRRRTPWRRPPTPPLVEKGPARAYGIYRSAPDLMSRDAYREQI
jgi:hypothetical protein